MNQQTDLPFLNKFRTLDTSNFNIALDRVRERFPSLEVVAHHELTFKVTYNCLDLDRISLHCGKVDTGFRVTSEPTSNDLLFVLILSGDLHIQTEGAQYSCHPHTSGAMFDFLHPATLWHQGYQALSLHFSRQVLRDEFTRLTGEPARTPLAFINPVNLADPGPHRLQCILSQIVAMFEQVPELIKEPLLVAEYEGLLLTAILTCLPHSYSHVFRTAPHAAMPKVVRLVETYLEANADKPLRIRDLAAVTGMGMRSIQLAFQKHRGYSPSHFLRDCRLARARQMLLQAVPGQSVLSVSLACGFASQSFFCHCYRERFGEKPSETLHKAGVIS
jgi:AraC-like DNA-binding protein